MVIIVEMLLVVAVKVLVVFAMPLVFNCNENFFFFSRRY